MAFPVSWAYRVAITIDHTKIDADLTDWTMVFDQAFNAFLTQINGPLDADGTCPSLNGGGDIRFSSDMDGAIRLACDIRSWATNNTPGSATCEAAIKVPSVSSAVDTTIYMWWGKAGETQPSVSDTYGQYNAYDSNFLYVSSDGGGTDRTSTGNTRTPSAAGHPTLDGVTGRVGTATSYDGTDDYTSAATATGLTSTAGTIQGHIKMSAFPDLADMDVLLSVHDVPPNTDAHAVHLYGVRHNSEGERIGIVIKPTAAYNYSDTRNTELSLDTWYFQALTHVDGSAPIVYLNDTVQTIAVEYSSPDHDNNKWWDDMSANTFSCGARHTGSNWGKYLNGVLDELRLSSTNRSAAWLKADYKNQSNASGFLKFGVTYQLMNLLKQGAANLGIYGDVYINEGSSAQSIATGAASLVTRFSADGANGAANAVTADKANNQITLTNAGIYRVVFSTSILGGTGNVKWEFEVHDIDGKVPGLCGHCETSSNGVSYTNFANYYVATAGAVLKMYVKHNQGGSEDLTLVDTQFTAQRVSG